MQSRAGWRAAAAATLLVLTGAGCSDGAEPERPDTRVEEVTGDTSGTFDLDEAEAGERVTLRATVAQVLSEDSFVIGERDTAGPPLLVVAEDAFEVGQELQLGGVLQVFDYADLSGERTLAAEERYRPFVDRLVLVADLVDDDLPLDDQ